jgi:hypothetical protein
MHTRMLAGADTWGHATHAMQREAALDAEAARRKDGAARRNAEMAAAQLSQMADKQARRAVDIAADVDAWRREGRAAQERKMQVGGCDTVFRALNTYIYTKPKTQT